LDYKIRTILAQILSMFITWITNSHPIVLGHC